MKMPWNTETTDDAAHGAPAAVLDAADSFEEQLAPLEARRQELESRRDEIDAEIAQRTDARTSQLLAGEAVTKPAGILPLREERFTVEQALASLALQISDVKAARTKASAIAGRQRIELAFVAAKEAADSARAAARAGIRDFIFTTFPALMEDWRTALAAERATAAAVGQTPGGSFLFDGLNTGGVMASLEAFSRMDPRAFDPPR